MNTHFNTSRASIDQSVKMPDLFGCDRCPIRGWQSTAKCAEQAEAGLCRAAILRDALKVGSVQIMLHIGEGR